MIKFLKGEYFFLNPNAPISVEYNGHKYRCVMSAYNAQKMIDEHKRKEFELVTGPQSSELLKKYPTREDWDEIKLQVMTQITCQKFKQHPFYAKKLLETGNEKIFYTNYTNDTYWGICKRIGNNYYGKILMLLREKFKKIDF